MDNIGKQSLFAIMMIAVIALILQCFVHNRQYNFAILLTQIVLQILCVFIQQIRYRDMDRKQHNHLVQKCEKDGGGVNK